MDVPDHDARGTASSAETHAANIAANLQLIADLSYGDVALARPADGRLVVTADARPMTAVAAVPATRVGQALDRADEPEAYDAWENRASVIGTRRRSTRGIAFFTSARPAGSAGAPIGVIIRDVVLCTTQREYLRGPLAGGGGGAVEYSHTTYRQTDGDS